MKGRFEVHWRPRERPLPPLAVAGRGSCAAALALRLLAFEEGDLGGLRGVAGAGLVIALGPAERLPWVDGAVYLGRDPEAPQLLLPTTHEPAIHPGLLERALLARPAAEGRRVPPFAVLLSPALLVSLAEARPIAKERLEAWLAAEGTL